MPLPGQTDVFDPRYGGRPLVPDPRETAARALNYSVEGAPTIRNLVQSFYPNLPQQTDALNRLLSTKAGSPSELSPEAISANLANIPNLFSMVGQVDPTISKRRGIIEEELAGAAPSDVKNFLRQQAAEWGTKSGLTGSQAEDTAFLRALGLFGVGQQAKGMTDAEKLATQIYNQMSPYFITPQQEAESRRSLLQTGLGESRALGGQLEQEGSRFYLTPDQQQAAELAANLYAAAPDPALAAQEAKRIQEEGAGKAGGTRGGTPTITPTYGGTKTPSRPEDPASFLDPFKVSGTRTGTPGTYTPPTYVAPNTPMTPQPFGPTSPAPDEMDRLIGRSAASTAQQAQINARVMQLMAQGYSYAEARNRAELEQRTGSFGGPVGDTSPTLAQFYGQQFTDLGLPLVNDVFPEIYGTATGPGEPPNYVEARTGSQYDYGQPFDYGTLPGFSAPAVEPANYVEARTGPEFDYGNIDFSTLPGFNFAPSDEEMDWYY